MCVPIAIGVLVFCVHKESDALSHSSPIGRAAVVCARKCVAPWCVSKLLFLVGIYHIEVRTMEAAEAAVVTRPTGGERAGRHTAPVW